MNPQYFAALNGKFQGASSCADLQNLVNETFASLAAQETAVLAEVAKLAPMLSLLSVSITDLPSVISFCENLISLVLTPYLKPTITYAAQLTAVAAEIATLKSTINGLASNFPSCSISFPTIP